MQGDASTALEMASEGLRLFRGDILDRRTATGPRPTAPVSRRSGWASSRTCMAARVDLGSGGELVGELETLVAQHPLRERLWGSLMTALYRGGRQADALAAYARVRRLLVDELGIEPGPDLRALEQQLLQQSTVLGGTPVLNPVTAPGQPAPEPHRAPGTWSRARRAARAPRRAPVRERRRARPASARPGSCSRRRGTCTVPGGVWLVRLEAVDSSADLEQVVAETLHVAGGAQLRERLSGAQTVLLLDNCEHVIDNVSALVGPLLDDLPGLRILATSQVPLGIDDELAYHLEPLSTEDSVALFWARAHEMRRQLVVDDDTTALVEEVCRSLDGLPLAIELAAARVRSLSFGDIARRLDDRFALLQDPSSHRPERRRALAGAIGWSYDLLFPDDQRGLWALSCFAGSASLEAVEHVLAALDVPAAAVVDTLTRLVDRRWSAWTAPKTDRCATGFWTASEPTPASASPTPD